MMLRAATMMLRKALYDGSQVTHDPQPEVIYNRGGEPAMSPSKFQDPQIGNHPHARDALGRM
jgi:hypothetical protein